MCCLYDSQNRFMVMVLAHLMQALSASRPRSEWYTRHPDKLLCNENTDEVATLRIVYYHQRGFMASIVHSSTSPYFEVVQMPPPFLSISYLKISQACSRFVSSVSYLLSKPITVKLSAFIILKYSSCLQRVGRL